MSLRARLLLLVLLAVMLPALLIGVRFFLERGQRIDAAVGDLSIKANDLAVKLNEKILGTLQLLYGLARAEDLDTGDRAACSTFLADVLEEHPQYTGILTIKPNGALFCDSIRTGRDLDLRDRKYFQQATSRGDGVALQPVFGRLTGTAVMQVARAARDAAGDLRFVLLASLNLETFVANRSQDGLEILLLDLDGNVMAWSPAATRGGLRGTALKDQPEGQPLFDFVTRNADGGSGEVIGIDGSSQIWAVDASPAMRNAGLRVLVGLSRSALVAPADQRLRGDMAVLALVAALLFLGVWLQAELGIRRQISRIVEMARHLGAGHRGARIPPPYPRDELGGLMRVLNGTAESLERQSDDIKDLNERVLQTQKMQAMGHLTGGVAHDFNNMLTVILACAEDIAAKAGDDAGLRQRAALVIAAAERGASLTRSLLAFARRQPLEPQSIDVNLRIRDMEQLLRRTCGDAIEVEFALGADVAPALVDPGQMETAILNLVINARDAMPAGGRLAIETANAYLDGVFAGGGEDVAAGDYVLISVGDVGSGMPPDVLAKAVEPFFTTKDVGKGTGLGLSMVYGFVKQSGGHVQIYSEVGQGTTVKVFLPRARGTALAAADLPRPIAAGAGELVLVVEDDDLVRSYVESEVRALGYAVTSARNGAEALEILHGPSTFDLLFTDVMMPGGMSGLDLAEQAVRLRPGLKVLLTSGYTESTVKDRRKAASQYPLLSKPYRREELATKLRVALQGVD
jgi:signal transduction histidine kinase/CheY-like chemotaxis protein